MLQIFHLDIARVDHNVTHVAMAIHVCFKCLFQMFHLFFHTFVVTVSSGCCICFTYIMQVFFLDVIYVCSGFFAKVSKCFANVLDACCKCFSYFVRMLQVFISMF
jgi:hypothetical protein